MERGALKNRMHSDDVMTRSFNIFLNPLGTKLFEFHDLTEFELEIWHA